MRNKIVLDARMVDKSGIGVYVRKMIENVLPIFDNYQIISNITSEKNVILSHSKIYTLKEQVDLLNVIPNCELFWSPHFNIPLFKIKAKKKLVTIHDINHLQVWFRKGLKSKFTSEIARFFIRKALNVSDKVITVSEFTKSELVKKFNVPVSKIDVIHLGVDFTRFNSHIKIDEDTLKKYNISKPYLLYLGNIKPHKNLLRLIQSFEKLGYTNYELIIAGEKDRFIKRHKEFYQIYQNLSRSIKECIKFTGFVDDIDLPKIISGSRLMIFPSLYEGFGLPPLEAMACGCPVVASNLGSIPEICGDAVKYFNPYDIDEMAIVISDVINNDQIRNDLITKGLERVKKFTWERCAQKHIEIINDLLNENTNS